MRDLISKAAVLLEALPYLQRYRGEIFVIKYGGSFMDSPDPADRNRVARDIVFLEAAGIKPVVIHGGGKAITRAMNAAGLPANFIQGMRVTDEAAVKVVDRVLSREINPEVVAAINSLKGRALGFAGTDVFTAAKLHLSGPMGEKLDLGFVGDVSGVKTAPLLDSLTQHFTPVISPTALGADGKIYNCNADVAAAQAAIALKARRLVFMSDVPGLLRDPKDPDSLIPRLRAGDVEELKKAGVIDRGMIPKVDSAIAALKAGVEKVSFVDGRVQHAMLIDVFTDEGVGTEVVL